MLVRDWTQAGLRARLPRGSVEPDRPDHRWVNGTMIGVRPACRVGERKGCTGGEISGVEGRGIGDEPVNDSIVVGPANPVPSVEAPGEWIRVERTRAKPAGTGDDRDAGRWAWSAIRVARDQYECSGKSSEVREGDGAMHSGPHGKGALRRLRGDGDRADHRRVYGTVIGVGAAGREAEGV